MQISRFVEYSYSYVSFRVNNKKEDDDDDNSKRVGPRESER